ncbi:unnamed protein product [Protopolystoma xenopodis]|uniref:Uncharacterized protein n=1 Tax=Protopolystoma xenopodis TaxID=117903 RepID=A0A448WK41_9PLAT|nr:unnamed protein product [Protopolystoma xenopodis]
MFLAKSSTRLRATTPLHHAATTALSDLKPFCLAALPYIWNAIPAFIQREFPLGPGSRFPSATHNRLSLREEPSAAQMPPGLKVRGPRGKFWEAKGTAMLTGRAGNRQRRCGTGRDITGQCSTNSGTRGAARITRPDQYQSNSAEQNQEPGA